MWLPGSDVMLPVKFRLNVKDMQCYFALTAIQTKVDCLVIMHRATTVCGFECSRSNFRQLCVHYGCRAMLSFEHLMTAC